MVDDLAEKRKRVIQPAGLQNKIQNVEVRCLKRSFILTLLNVPKPISGKFKKILKLLRIPEMVASRVPLKAFY